MQPAPVPAPALREQRRPSRARPALAALLTLAAFLGVTAFAWSSMVDVAHEDAAARFEASADQATAAVGDELSHYGERLRDIGVLATASGSIPPPTFATSVDDTHLFEQLPSIAGVLTLARVPDADLEAFLSSARAIDPDFAVAQIGPTTGDVHLLLTAYAPGRVDLQLPVGADVSAIAAVADLAERSSATGSAVAGSFQDDPLLVRTAGRNEFPMIDALLGLDFFLGIPLYPPGTEVAGPPNLPSGWIVATVDDFDEVARSTTVALPDDLGMELRVELDGAGGAATEQVSRVAEVEGDAGPRRDAAFEATRTIETDGVTWTLAVWSGPDADDAPPAARAALGSGIAGSVLAAGIVYVGLRERDRKRAYASDTAQRERFQREILDSVTNPMVVVGGDGRIVRANPAWDDLWPERPEAPEHRSQPWVGVRYVDVIGAAAVDGVDDLEAAIAGVIEQRFGTTDVDVALRAPIGDRDATEIEPDPERSTADARQPTWLAVRVTPLRDRRGAILIHTDVTERRRTQAQLEVQAARDVLTGLANRSTFEEAVARALTVHDPEGHRVAVLFVDLDGFKPVNDTHGHAVGDEVLRAIGRRIASVVRASDTAGRLGGDEFAVLIDPLADASVAAATADRILAALSTPIRTDAGEVIIGASIGAAVVDTPTPETAASLIRRADVAMYASKQQGGARTTVVGV